MMSEMDVFFWGAVVKLRKSNYNLRYVMSVCLSVFLYETPQLLLDGFLSNLTLKYLI